MAAIVLPSTIHDPSTGAIATAAWGDAVNAAIAWLTAVPSARVYKAATQSLTNNTLTAINFDTERYDTDTIHDTVTNNTRLTCKTAGLYHFEGCAEFAGNATGHRSLHIRLNGSASNYLAVATMPLTGSAVVAGLVVSADYRMIVNDYVELVAWQTSGGALNVQAGGNTYSPEFSMRWVAS